MTTKRSPGTETVIHDDPFHLKQERRRRHNKSRAGCLCCKRRHVKCDESRPSCNNCERLRLKCEYTPHSSNANDSRQSDILNLKLFFNYSTTVASTIADLGIEDLNHWQVSVPELSFKHPFLLHAILMISAAHLAQSEPDVYKTVAVKHQNEAMNMLPPVKRNNAHAVESTLILLLLTMIADKQHVEDSNTVSFMAYWIRAARYPASSLLSVVAKLPPTMVRHTLTGRLNRELILGVQSCQLTELSPIFGFVPELESLRGVPNSSPYYEPLRILNSFLVRLWEPDVPLNMLLFPAMVNSYILDKLQEGDQQAKAICLSYFYLASTRFEQRPDGYPWCLHGVLCRFSGRSRQLEIPSDRSTDLDVATSAISEESVQPPPTQVDVGRAPINEYMKSNVIDQELTLEPYADSNDYIVYPGLSGSGFVYEAPPIDASSYTSQTMPHPLFNGNGTEMGKLFEPFM